MKQKSSFFLTILAVASLSLAETPPGLMDEEIQKIILGFSQGKWQRAMVATFDAEAGTWAQQEPGERWWMEKISSTAMRSYADEGDPWEISLSPSAYVVTVLDENGAVTGESIYHITSADVSSAKDWRLTIENQSSEPQQVIEMAMFGDNYLFTLWTRDEDGNRRDRWIALSHRLQSEET